MLFLPYYWLVQFLQYQEIAIGIQSVVSMITQSNPERPVLIDACESWNKRHCCWSLPITSSICHFETMMFHQYNLPCWFGLYLQFFRVQVSRLAMPGQSPFEWPQMISKTQKQIDRMCAPFLDCFLVCHWLQQSTHSVSDHIRFDSPWEVLLLQYSHTGRMNLYLNYNNLLSEQN